VVVVVVVLVHLFIYKQLHGQEWTVCGRDRGGRRSGWNDRERRKDREEC